MMVFIEFNLLINGANAQRVDNLNKREKQRVTEARSKSRESKRSWGLPTIPIRVILFKIILYCPLV